MCSSSKSLLPQPHKQQQQQQQQQHKQKQEKLKKFKQESLVPFLHCKESVPGIIIFVEIEAFESQFNSYSTIMFLPAQNGLFSWQ